MSRLQASLHVAARGLAPSEEASDTPLGPRPSPVVPGVCYSALRRLPRRDLHPLEKNSVTQPVSRPRRHDAPSGHHRLLKLDRMAHEPGRRSHGRVERHRARACPGAGARRLRPGADRPARGEARATGVGDSGGGLAGHLRRRRRHPARRDARRHGDARRAARPHRPARRQRRHRAGHGCPRTRRPDAGDRVPGQCLRRDLRHRGAHPVDARTRTRPRGGDLEPGESPRAARRGRLLRDQGRAHPARRGNAARLGPRRHPGDDRPSRLCAFGADGSETATECRC